MKIGTKNRLLFSASMALVLIVNSGVAAAQETPDGDVASEESEAITVIGSRSKEARTVLDTAVPVDVLKAEDLQSQGSTDIIDTLTSVAPSLNASREPISDAATMVRPVNLRGLSSDSTLVLVNGKRRHRGAVVGEFVTGVNRGSQGVDVNPLFGAAMKDVQILRDGASAQYGSDAIAGVINYTLNDNPEVRNVTVQFGQAYRGDGRTIEGSANFGFKVGDGGYVTLAAQVKDQEPTSRGVQDGIGDRGGAAGLQAAGFPVANPVVVWGQPEVKNDYKFAINSALPVGDAEVYLFGTYATRDVDGSFFYRNPARRTGVFVDGNRNVLFANTTGVGSCPVGQLPTTSFAAAQAFINAAPSNCFAFFRNFPGGFTPRFGGKVTDKALTTGFRGDISDFKYDFSVGFGSNKVDYKIRNSLNASLGPNSPTSFAVGAQKESDIVANADFTYGADLGLASPLNIAFGVQYLKEEFEISPGQRESYIAGPYASQGFSVGSNGFQGFSERVSGAFNRHSTAAYLDLEADVTEAFLLSGALRFEKYSDFGSTTNAKIAARYKLGDNFALRGSFSTGFRAPTLGQSFLQRASTGFSGGQLVEQLVVASTNPIAVFFGGGQLDPEKARNFSLGATASLGRLKITADYFNIRVKDRTSLTSKDINAADRARLLSLGIAEAATVSNVNFFVNDFDTKTSGFDIVATYPINSGLGKTDLTLAYNHNATKVTNPGTTVNPGRKKEIEDALPANRFTFTALHKTGAFSGLVRLNYFGSSYESLFSDDTLPVSTPALVMVDAELGFDVANHFKIAVGAKNLFNKYPKEWTIGTDTGRSGGYLGAIYPLNHPAGFNGGSYYVRVSTNF